MNLCKRDFSFIFAPLIRRYLLVGIAMNQAGNEV